MIRPHCQPILTAARMREAEDAAIAAGATTETLMECAGAAVARTVRRLAGSDPVLVLCGPGNNGGDGYVAARLLAAAGQRVRVAALRAPGSAAAIAARARWTGPVETIDEASPAPVLIDALFGTGLKRPLEADVAAHLARLAGAAALSIAVDVPSGVSTDDGSVLGASPVDLTLALGALKPAHVLEPAAGLARAIRVLDIGVPTDSEVATLGRPRVAAPSAHDHKYSRGLVAVLGGGMPGAAALASIAAAGAGAGYVLLLGSSTDRLPHAVVRRRFDAAALDDPRIGAVVIGPGLGRDDAARVKLAAGLASPHPLVIDGDALRLVDPEALRAREAAVILTPHSGEFDHLFGESPDGSRPGKIARTVAAAECAGAIVVHKGADTVIAASDGRARVAIERAPWLSAAGTGDVLAGTIAARLASRGDALAAACEGVWLHSAAARAVGPAFVADALAAALPAAIATCL